MNEELHRLAKRIRDELEYLEIVLQRAREGWKRFQQSTDDYYLDSVALNLHGFYNGLESVFEQIAVMIDGHKPCGENWHQALLKQMGDEISTVRPAVLSKSSREGLDEYRGFRHVVRNVYSYRFDPVKIQRLVEQAPGLFSQITAELQAFADFLDRE